MRDIHVLENGINIQWRVEKNGDLKLLHFSSQPFCEEDIVKGAIPEGFSFIGMNLSGFDRPYERHGNKYIVTAPGYRMKYVGHKDERNSFGRLVTIHTKDEKTEVHVKSYLQFYDGLSIIRIWHKVVNYGQTMQTLEYLSNFQYEGIEKEGKLCRDKKLKIWIPHNSWQREMNWKSYTFAQLGMEQVQLDDIQRSSGLIRVSNVGNWSTKEYLPMGVLENTETNSGLFWQIEHNGSWYWEIGDQNGHMYLALGGPNEIYSHWFKNLMPGESFETVKAAVGVTNQGLDDAIGTLTEYRRIIRRKNEDNEALPVIFNDYMNCLWGKPEAEKEYRLIRAAADVGCEYFCIDAGWYADGDWWNQVGEWKESTIRFPEGLRKVTEYIRNNGMIPGVWLEPEVMGIRCKLASNAPDDWFFMRHGKRVYDRSRYQLDYRNPQVRNYMTHTVTRLVEEYGVGYIKMDYNIEPGIGTELNAESVGEGLLEHERSYLSWLDSLWEKYPDLIIENCSSGGLRIDYAMLSRCSIQSTSDQDDFLQYAVIAANAPSGVTPEQAAVWAYPMNHDNQLICKDDLREETVFNMINAMLLRIHQSGQLDTIDDERRNLVKEGIKIYKIIRNNIKAMRPFWPLGFADFADRWVSMGLQNDERAYLAVWKRKEGEDEIVIPIKEEMLKGRTARIECIYPGRLFDMSNTKYCYNATKKQVHIRIDRIFAARLFEIRFE
ncbi:MAG: glycoside hydrolase family 36 protein [Lachnospiraceae bacterium]